MFTRTICGAVLALISFSIIPGSDPQPKDSPSDQIAALNLELAQAIEQLSNDEKLHALSGGMAALAEQQEDIISLLDGMANQLKKTSAVKYVTRSDLDEAISTAKESVTKAKEFSSGCDCDCQSKLDALEKRIAALEAKCSAVTLGSTYATKSGGSNGTVGVAQSYSTQSSSYQTTSSGGCTGSISASSYAPSNVSIEIPSQTRTVKVVEPRTRRQVTFAEVPENADVSLAYQQPATVSQCFTDENGNRVCSQSAQPVQATTRAQPKLGSRLRSIFGR